MKTFEKDIIKLFVVVIIINVIAFLISMEAQVFYMKNFSELLEEVKYTPGNSYAGVITSNSKYLYGISSTDGELQFCVETSKSQTQNDTFSEGEEYVPSFCIQGIGVSILFSLPFIFYFLIFILTVLYFVYKISKILKEMNMSFNNIKKSLNDGEVHEISYKYREMKEISDVVNKSIYMFKRNELLEKELINSVVHDLKTPLHIIAGYNDMQIKSLSNNEFNLKIKEQIENINEIIENTLIDKYFKLNQVNILFVIQELVSGYNLIYSDVHIKVICGLKEVYFNVDITTFKRVIINVIDNAVEALSSNKEIKIYIGKDSIKIINYGILFSQDEFEKYINSKDITKEGLGLKIIYKNCLANSLNIKYEVKEEPMQTAAIISKVKRIL